MYIRWFLSAEGQGKLRCRQAAGSPVEPNQYLDKGHATYLAVPVDNSISAIAEASVGVRWEGSRND